MWLYKGLPYEIDITKYVAFVYLITNKLTGRKYIGLKTTISTKIRQIKGKKKKYKIESDWKNYWSSSEILKKDIKELGEDNFTREILYFCVNKGSANYLEAKEQFDNRVLENPELWYNGIINCRCNYKHLKLEQCK